VKVLELLEKKGPLSRSEIAKGLGHKMISGRLNLHLKNMLEKDIIAYTIPDKPKSRLQKYKIVTK